MSIKSSELILNKRGAVYHLDLRPEEIGNTVLLVGDPGRVKQVSTFFDQILYKRKNREFITHTGILNEKKISVISSGIGTDNIDIVMNELDALVNVDLELKKRKKQLKKLRTIRIGTCGAIQHDVAVNSFVVTEHAMGLDGLLYYYKHKSINNTAVSKAFEKHCKWNKKLPAPYVVSGNTTLIKLLGKDNIIGNTITATGFYAPQGRVLRIELADPIFLNRLSTFSYKNFSLSNFEMETSAIYALGKIMGHNTCTICLVVANRVNGTFSTNYPLYVKKLIRQCLQRLTS